MSSPWAAPLDDLAAASAQLLVTGGQSQAHLTQPLATLVAREFVVQELRTLVAGLVHAPSLHTTGTLTIEDVLHRPGLSLHQALSGLPRSISTGAVNLTALDPTSLTGYEQAWHRAADAAGRLEVFNGPAVQRFPDRTAWWALRDLTDVAGALEHLDHDLAQALLPHDADPQIATARQALQHHGHDALRIVATELRGRIPAYNHQSAVTHGRETGATPSGIEHTQQLLRYRTSIAGCGASLSTRDLHSVAMTLTHISRHTGQVLQRTAAIVPEVEHLVDAVQRLGDAAQQLRQAHVATHAPEHVDVIGRGRDLVRYLQRLAQVGERLPADAPSAQLHRLAAPALTAAEHLPPLAATLRQAVRDSLDAGQMLVPGVVDERARVFTPWVSAAMAARAKRTPEVLAATEGLREASAGLSRVLDRVGHPARAGGAGPRTAVPTPAVRAALTSAGSARAHLRTVLADRVAAQPAMLAPPLPSHPRHSPHRQRP